jgi:hypothetical protein
MRFSFLFCGKFKNFALYSNKSPAWRDGWSISQEHLHVTLKDGEEQICEDTWLERPRKDLMILTSRVRFHKWDVGSGPSDKAVQIEVLCRSRWGT